VGDDDELSLLCLDKSGDVVDSEFDDVGLLWWGVGIFLLLLIGVFLVLLLLGPLFMLLLFLGCLDSRCGPFKESFFFWLPYLQACT